MAVRKLPSGKWLADVSIGGRLSYGGERIRKSFRTQKEALSFEYAIRGNFAQGKAWNFAHKSQDYRLSELCDSWYQIHGKNLKDGLTRMKTLNKICKELKDPFFSQFKGQDFLIYRANNTKVCANTLNHYLAYLNAVFNELIRINQIDSNPLLKIKRLKIAATELSYLKKNEIEMLLQELKNKKSDAYIVTKICLSTGARWREACNIKAKDVQNNKINILGKNGKIRYLSITKELATEIINQAPFCDPYTTFKKTIKKLALKKNTGQLTHILRHTFASHFIMNGGNILALQKILDHSTLNMTMRYAHLAPEHLQEITKLNPINF